ncbi:hypothetical protein PG999_008973 [Apiospora kogelbergensis]|uniref:Transmembrane protein n=1 Tax=Apiospora kogelbergensis TaxID=1337665 RepID=A0AAW0QPV3_9PEZI
MDHSSTALLSRTANRIVTTRWIGPVPRKKTENQKIQDAERTSEPLISYVAWCTIVTLGIITITASSPKRRNSPVTTPNVVSPNHHVSGSNAVNEQDGKGEKEDGGGDSETYIYNTLALPRRPLPPSPEEQHLYRPRKQRYRTRLGQLKTRERDVLLRRLESRQRATAAAAGTVSMRQVGHRICREDYGDVIQICWEVEDTNQIRSA